MRTQKQPSVYRWPADGITQVVVKGAQPKREVAPGATEIIVEIPPSAHRHEDWNLCKIGRDTVRLDPPEAEESGGAVRNVIGGSDCRACVHDDEIHGGVRSGDEGRSIKVPSDHL